MYEVKDENGKITAVISAAHPGQTDCLAGVWLTLKGVEGVEPTLCMVQRADKSWYFGVYRDIKQPPFACDLAIEFDKIEGPILQIAKGNEVQQVNLLSFISDFVKKAG